MRPAAASFFLLAAQFVLLQPLEAQFLKGVEIAPYTVIKEGEGYEERAYPASPWVCRNNNVQEPAMSTDSFWPLFGYMSGMNSNNEFIPMTAPITVKTAEDTEAGNSTSQMCFYLPESHHQNPPAPVTDDLLLENRPATNVFSRRTGGNLTSEQWRSLANELRTILESAEPTADLSFYYVAGYDSPSTATDRRNEVWFQKTQTELPVTPDPPPQPTTLPAPQPSST